MSWFGKIIGGTIGFALGGPLGAIAGAAFGHTFDAGNDELETRYQNNLLSNGETAQLTFFVATFSMLAKLAKADGQITQEELKSINDFMENDLSLNYRSQNVAMNIFQTALDSPGTFFDFAAQFYTEFRLQPRLLEVMIDILLRVSAADGEMNNKEEELILAAVKIFNFSESRYKQLKAKYIKEVDRYYAILNSSRADTDHTIKQQYRKLVQEYHPDKILAKGLPEEFTKFANDKFIEIQEAYEMVKIERNIN